MVACVAVSTRTVCSTSLSNHLVLIAALRMSMVTLGRQKGMKSDGENVYIHGIDRHNTQYTCHFSVCTCTWHMTNLCELPKIWKILENVSSLWNIHEGNEMITGITLFVYNMFGNSSFSVHVQKKNEDWRKNLFTTLKLVCSLPERSSALFG